ncbi:MAG: hypothetical protein H0Z34_01065 [Brevibacillus sp.]|nr:hypothetical protein [Brevibacillus sp.]
MRRRSLLSRKHRLYVLKLLRRSASRKQRSRGPSGKRGLRVSKQRGRSPGTDLLTTRYYRPIQKLMLLKGYKVSLRQLKKVPLKRTLAYIRTHFSQEVVAKYMPLERVYPREEIRAARFPGFQSGDLLSRPQPEQPAIVRSVVKQPARARRQSRSRIVSRRRKRQRSHTFLDMQQTSITQADLSTTQPAPEPFVTTAAPAVPPVLALDLNKPAPLTEEVSATAAETQRVNHIFTFTDNHPFDPGIWSIIVSSLPQEYNLPDHNFTQRLEQAQTEVVNAHYTGQVEPLRPDSIL